MTLTVEQQYLLDPDIIRIPAHTDENGNHYNLVSDIVAVFGVGPYLFKVGSVIVPILKDDQGGWQVLIFLMAYMHTKHGTVATCENVHKEMVRTKLLMLVFYFFHIHIYIYFDCLHAYFFLTIEIGTPR